MQPTFSRVWILIAQWLEHLTGDQNVVGSSFAWELRNFLIKNRSKNIVITMLLLFNRSSDWMEEDHENQPLEG